MLAPVAHSDLCFHPCFRCNCPNCGFILSGNHFQTLPHSTRVALLARTNDAPLDQEQGQLRQQYFAALRRVHALDDHIVRTEAALKAMKQEREQIAKFAKTYQSILHPLRKTPSDVLCEIFHSCMDSLNIHTPLDNSLYDSLDSIKMPWVLSQICHRWRQVALSTPMLWSRLSFSVAGLEDIETLELSSRMRLLALYLQRSQSVPLTLGLHSACDLELDDPCIHPILGILFSHVQRLRTVHFGLSADVLSALSSIRGLLPTLHSLHLTLRSDESYHNLVVDINKTFEFAPSLREVFLNGVPSSLTLPWHQLTRYRWTPAEPNVYDDEHNFNMLGVLRSAPRLEYCTFDNCLIVDEDEDVPTRHNNLHSLSLSGSPSSVNTSDCVAGLINSLTLPTLRSLEIRTSFRHFDALHGLQGRSSYTLTTLLLWDLPILNAETFRLIVAHPHLERLALGTSSLISDTGIIAFLTSTPANPSVVPRLRVLQLLGQCGPPTLTHDAITTMLETRATPVKNAGLKKFDLFWVESMPSFGTKDSARLCLLKSTCGMEISFVSHKEQPEAL